MSVIAMLVIGVICLVVAYQVPTLPPPLRTILNVLGWILVAVGLILLVLGLLGIATPVLALR